MSKQGLEDQPAPTKTCGIKTSPGVVSSAATEEVTAVDAVGRQVADAIARSEGAGFGIGVAEIR
ncbi:hypothetical protein EYF80_022202 [Liparis tanakae]|uniref:Uncharacterized protein n=1 Tax=Liparis tanakae TaxID=230148 RepID=A0A4Z2HNX1_9TELE|nr:hypothetical protein EYF80_022202 [Liparis tanakae]